MTDWQKIKEDYEAKQETVKMICATHSVSAAELYKKAHEENWALRSVSQSKRRHPAQQTENGPDRKALINRLYKAFDYQMREFETHLSLADEEGVNEKDARTLGSLARTLEKLIELRQEDEGLDDNQNKGVDIEGLREELARRLERLCPKGQAE